MLMKRLAKQLWWFVPLVAGIILVAGARNVYITIGMTVFLIVSEGIFVRIVLASRTGRERFFAAMPLMFFVFLIGAVLLFLERIVVTVPLIAGFTFLVGFAHYTIIFAARSSTVELRVVSADAYRLIAHASMYCIALLFFATLFYFGMTSAMWASAFLLLPPVVSWWRTWFEGIPLRERLMHTLIFEIIFLEASMVLLWLPVPYIFSALIIVLVHFLYSEFVIAPRDPEGSHRTDKALSFVIVLIVLLLLMIVTRFR